MKEINVSNRSTKELHAYLQLAQPIIDQHAAEDKFGQVWADKEQLQCEILAVRHEMQARKQLREQIENGLLVVLLFLMLSMGAWLGPVAKLVLGWFN